jgi:hypothetical protein
VIKIQRNETKGMLKVRLILLLLAVCFLVTGCTTSGIVYEKKHDTYPHETWMLCIRDSGGNTDCPEVDEQTWNSYKIGDHYPGEKK